jgi:hypothetical protein
VANSLLNIGLMMATVLLEFGPVAIAGLRCASTVKKPPYPVRLLCAAACLSSPSARGQSQTLLPQLQPYTWMKASNSSKSNVNVEKRIFPFEE